MASACVNNVGVSPGKFSSWLTPSRVSFTRDDKGKAVDEREKVSEKSDLENDDDGSDFEFCLGCPFDLLPAADQLISDGKLMPMTMTQQKVKKSVTAEVLLPETVDTRMSTGGGGGGKGGDPFLFSPKAPRCASRWKEILGLKKLHQNSINNNNSNKSLKNLLLNRNSKSSSSDSSAGGLNLNHNLPLLRDPECESLSVSSSRLSLSSSSSGHELDDFPRLSLDAEKHTINPVNLLKNNYNPPPRLRLVKPRPAEANASRPIRKTVSTDQSQGSTGVTALGVNVDSPRMNSSGKIVFQSLERSSSSPGSFNGGPRLKHGGMERSYSANVRASTVLNVPVCSLSKSGSVFGLFSSQQKRDLNGRSYQCISHNSNIINGRKE